MYMETVYFTLFDRNMHSQKIFKNIFLDDSFVICFAPIHIVQKILASSRSNIKNNSVTSLTAGQKLYTLIWILCFTFSFFYLELHFFKEFYQIDTVLNVASVIGLLVQFISYVSNMINVRFLSNTSSKEVYVLIQEIDDLLLLKQYKKLKHNQYYWHIALMVLLVFPLESGFICSMVLTVDYPAFTIFFAVGLLITCLDLLLTGSLIYYITIRLKYLNKIIKYNICIKYPGFNKRTTPVVNQDLVISPDAADDTPNLNLDKFLLSLKQILRSYNKIIEVFRFTVFNVTATCFSWTLVVIEAIVVGLRSQLLPHVAMVCASLFTIYYFILLWSLAFVNDIFIREVRLTKLHCIYVMSYYFEGVIREAANEILRTIQFAQPEFSVYGIFVLDKSLIFKLIGIITTNVVVLIQFTV